MNIEVPVFRFEAEPALLQALREAADRVIASNWYVLGREVESFEREFAAYCGSAHCVGVANGTDALELALRAIGVGRGDRVLTTANAGGYTATALRAIGAEPAYVDVGDHLLMTATELGPQLEDARAVVVTHLYGHMAPIDAIVEVARAANVPVIEDCAQAHGAVRNGKSAGTFGAMGCFSFYPTKNLGAIGDGGAVVTSDAGLATTLRALRQYGWGTKYRIDRGGGRNSRLDEIQAAFLRVKLPYLQRWNAARVEIARRYYEGLQGLPLQVPVWRAGEYVAHLFVVRCTARDALRAHLAAAGIGTEIHYPIPDYAQPIERRLEHPHLPRTEAASREVLTLPCYPGMPSAETDRVIAAIRSFYAAPDHA